MKKLLLVVLLLASMCAWGQGATVLFPRAVNQNGSALPFAKITFCTTPATLDTLGNCTNTISVFQDQGLTIPYSSAILTDGIGYFPPNANTATSLWFAPAANLCFTLTTSNMLSPATNPCTPFSVGFTTGTTFPSINVTGNITGAIGTVFCLNGDTGFERNAAAWWNIGTCTPGDQSGTLSLDTLFDNQNYIAAGTAAAPSRAFKTDSASGVYLSSAGVVGISGGGTASATFSATGVTVPGTLGASSVNGSIAACQQSGADAGAKINTAIAALPAAGGTIWVDRSCAGSFATTIAVTKTAHIIFDIGAWTYTGAGDAINVSVAVRGVVIEGSGSGDVNGPTAATSITVTNTAANGANILNSPSGELKNIAFIGPGSGTGVGVHLTGNGFIVDNVLVKSFGSDGWQIDGTRGNSNSITMLRAMSYSNGANGFNTFGADGNLIQWISTDAQTNTTRNYLFNGVMNQNFDGLQTQMATDATGILFQGSSANWGSIYSEPVTPFAAACVNFDATSVNNNVFLLNCRKVTDAGGATNGNQWYFAASDAGVGVTGTGQANRASPNVNAAFNLINVLTRAQQSTELCREGMFLKSASFFTGYEMTCAASMNYIFNTGNTAGNFLGVYHNCTGDISGCTPDFKIDSSGNTVLGGTLTLGSETFSKEPRSTWSGFVSSLSGIQSYALMTTEVPITITRLTLVNVTPPVTCSPFAVVSVFDNTASSAIASITEANATTVDSGSISINVAASHSLLLRTTTAAAGCGTTAANVNITMQYKVQ